ncbi:MAG: hypothetical protein NTZ42_01055 [Candidatus Gribaldobacteria bacterium]|nr:hypothetical protein [Candidatus Gribaldobacteria bacterium]
METEKLNSFEAESEHIPTVEEVFSILHGLEELKGKQYEETFRREDEKGLYLLEIVILGEKNGEAIELRYMRKGEYPEGQTLTTGIHAVYYKNNIPISGTSAAKYTDGKWEIL